MKGRIHDTRLSEGSMSVKNMKMKIWLVIKDWPGNIFSLSASEPGHLYSLPEASIRGLLVSPFQAVGLLGCGSVFFFKQVSCSEKHTSAGIYFLQVQKKGSSSSLNSSSK